MNRLLLLALIPLAMTGCRSYCGRAALATPACAPQMTPVSYGSTMSPMPASYSRPLGVTAMPMNGFPAIPPPAMNATELPFPQEMIPSPGVPLTGMPNGARSVGLPK